MTLEDILNDDFLKQFKDGTELTSFLEQLYKRGVEKILEGDLDEQIRELYDLMYQPLLFQE